MNRFLTTVIAVLLLALSRDSFAAVIYDNGNHILNGRTCNWNNTAADNFVLGAGANVVSDVHWKGFYCRFQFRTFAFWKKWPLG
jgi:hypothetical protein